MIMHLVLLGPPHTEKKLEKKLEFFKNSLKIQPIPHKKLEFLGGF
jgi:hypothetical protein